MIHHKSLMQQNQPIIEKLNLINSSGREISLEIMLIRLEIIRKTIKTILEEGCSNRNREVYGLKGKINTLLHKFDINVKFFLCKIEWN